MACSPCVFGAVSTTLLSFPINIATVGVSIIPVISIGNDSIPTTSYLTSTLSPTITATTPANAPPVTTITYTAASQLTWTTLGTVLTYPTTYVEYLSFEGAAATGSGCASSLSPTPLKLPAGIASASLLYPLDYTEALPAGLLSYLDDQPAFISQLNGDKLTTCGAIAGLAPPTASIQSVVLTYTSTAETTQTITSTIPPPTTITTIKSSTTTKTTVAPATVAATTGILVSSFTGPPIVISGAYTTSLTALGVDASSSTSTHLSSQSGSSTTSTHSSSQSGSSTTSTHAGTSSSSTSHTAVTVTSQTLDLSSVLSVLSSKASVASVMSSGIYTNSTTVTSTHGTTIAPTTTTAVPQYTGAATALSLPGAFWIGMTGFLSFVFCL